MKNMILAATAVGAALAGSLLYLRKKSAGSKDAALSAGGVPATRSQHAMG